MRRALYRWGFALCLGLCLLLCACKTSESAEPPKKNVEGAAVELPDSISLPYVKTASFDPLTTTSRVNFELCALLYDPLVLLDETMRPIPFLAQSIETEGLRVTVTLRPNVRFQDGTPLTAADVAATFSRILEGGTHYDARLRDVAAVEQLDETSLLITLRRENSLFASLLEIPIVKQGSAGEGSTSVGSGKYRFDALNACLVRNEDWIGGRIPLTEISLVDAPDQQSAAFSLSAGNLSLMTTFGSKLTLNSLRSVTNNLVFLGVNPSCAALSTAPLRRALSAVLSRSTLLDDNVASGGFVALSPINPRWFLFDSAAVSRGTDPSYAETALREEGYLLNEETGLLTSTSGKTLSLRLLYNGANAGRAALALSIVNQLTDFGYAVTPVEASAAEYPRLVASGSFDLYLGEVRLTPDMNLSPLVETGGSLNTARFSSAALDEALRAMKSASAEQLEAAAFAMIEALDRETPVIPLYFSIEELVLGEPALETVLAPTPTNPLAGLEQLTLSGE
ncbi:MAG: hypothetical protein IJL15_00740 [Clostridia bacterium]|nr:hypothetical protein [Clostridia bacterium]